ncbi:MAG TPA: helix-turn-helix transcriptional regulator [Candidatus Acidoferrum sp.]|nr:helix-turn-helix transcriptional regulator [Candidatus Acidoferrum sp.]
MVRARRPSATAVALTAVPEADRTRAFVGELRTLVKATYLCLARYDRNGTESEVVLDEEHGNTSRQLEWLQAERILQARSDTSMPRVTMPMIALDGMHGLVAVYGFDHVIFGLVIVARNRGFSEEERRALESTLRPGSELLRRVSTFDGEKSARERMAERAMSAHYVLSRDYRVELKWTPPAKPNENDALQEILALSDGLPPVVESSVRRLTASWTNDPAACQPGSDVPLPFIVVRTYPLHGEDQLKIGVIVERFRSRNPLLHAQAQFGMSARELEVLVLVLKGLGTPQIASELDIAESTAHDHIKRMIHKTGSRNRAELAAKALGWRGA